MNKVKKQRERKSNVIIYLAMIAATVLMLVFASCKDDENMSKMTMITAKSEVGFRLGGAYTADIDWGDVSPKEIVELSIDPKAPHNAAIRLLHSYSNEMPHTITITGNNVTHLDCLGLPLTLLDVNNNSALFSLDCSYSQLTQLNLSGLTKLEYLFCENNQLSSLDVNKLTNLKLLRCNDNQFTSLNISKLTKLFLLECRHNQLTSLDVSELDNLSRLSCSYNQLTSLDASGLTKLNYLDCSYNYMSATALNALFASLPHVAGSTRIDIAILNNGPDHDGSGSRDCDITIAEKKGWFVIR